MYMLDTNAIILEYGAKKSKDPDRTRAGIYTFLSGIPVLDFDSNAARHFGDILGDLDISHMRISDRDAMIAGHARSRGYTIVTNNVRDFSRVQGLNVEDWIV